MTVYEILHGSNSASVSLDFFPTLRWVLRRVNLRRVAAEAVRLAQIQEDIDRVRLGERPLLVWPWGGQ